MLCRLNADVFSLIVEVGFLVYSFASSNCRRIQTRPVEFQPAMNNFKIHTRLVKCTVVSIYFI